MWENDNGPQLRVRQHFKIDLPRIGRTCLVWSEQTSLELLSVQLMDKRAEESLCR